MCARALLCAYERRTLRLKEASRSEMRRQERQVSSGRAVGVTRGVDAALRSVDSVTYCSIILHLDDQYGYAKFAKCREKRKLRRNDQRGSVCRGRAARSLRLPRAALADKRGI